MAVAEPIQVLHYLTADGRIPYEEWLDTVKDPKGYAAIQGRTDRLERGLFGDARFVGEGVWELRIDTGPGYRVYYARAGKVLVILLCGGSKRTQDTDIETAKAYWSDYEKRTATRSRTK
jgi:putative addiction module killer protein